MAGAKLSFRRLWLCLLNGYRPYGADYALLHCRYLPGIKNTGARKPALIYIFPKLHITAPRIATILLCNGCAEDPGTVLGAWPQGNALNIFPSLSSGDHAGDAVGVGDENGPCAI